MIKPSKRAALLCPHCAASFSLIPTSGSAQCPKCGEYFNVDRTTKRGGARPGSGRPKTGRKPYLVRMKPTAMRRLKSRARPLPVGEWLEGTV